MVNIINVFVFSKGLNTPIKCEVLEDEQNSQQSQNHLENGDVPHTTGMNNSCSSTQTEQKYASGIENSLESSYFVNDNKKPTPPMSPISFKLNEGEDEEPQYNSVSFVGTAGLFEGAAD